MSEEVTSRVTVTSENRAEFMAEKLDLSTEPEVLAAEAELEPESTEDKPEPENDTSDKESKPNKLEKRFSEITQKQREAESKAQREADRADRAERELQELRSKSQPQDEIKEPDDLVEPDRSKYTDAFEYAKDLANFAAKNAIKQRDIQDRQAKANEQRQVVVTNWQKQLEVARTEIPDFDEVLASTTAGVPDAVRDAIIELDVGAKVLYHLAENPEVADKLAAMPEAKAMLELGKLAAKFETPSESKAEPVAKVSKAPPPITPVKAATVTDSYFDSKGEFTGTPAQYRELRKAGKIR